MNEDATKGGSAWSHPSRFLPLDPRREPGRVVRSIRGWPWLAEGRFAFACTRRTTRTRAGRTLDTTKGGSLRSRPSRFRGTGDQVARRIGRTAPDERSPFAARIRPLFPRSPSGSVWMTGPEPFTSSGFVGPPPRAPLDSRGVPIPAARPGPGSSPRVGPRLRPPGTQPGPAPVGGRNLAVLRIRYCNHGANPDPPASSHVRNGLRGRHPAHRVDDATRLYSARRIVGNHHFQPERLDRCSGSPGKPALGRPDNNQRTLQTRPGPEGATESSGSLPSLHMLTRCTPVQ